MQEQMKDFELLREHDQVFIQFRDTGTKTPVKLVWARPLTSRGTQVSLVDEKKREVLMLDSLDWLSPASRKIAEEELRRRYVLPRITRVIQTSADFGVRYWRVETNLGERRFALKHASKHAIWLTDDHLVLEDTLGCRYEIKPYSALDGRSRAEVEKVL